VKEDIDQFGQPLRMFPAHWIAAAVAMIGAVAIQWMWPAAIFRDDGKRWWPLTLAVTAYLLATARFHLSMARWRPNELVPRLWSLGRWLVCDFVIGILAGILVVEGHHTPIFQAGLWLIPPVLVAVSAASALTAVLALRDGLNRFYADVPPADAPIAGYRRDVPRMVCFTLLAILLLAIR
jgi:hypothetical protein